jgi:cyclic-di-GMP phosphodiesterase TipF (flagellum assembly factor)
VSAIPAPATPATGPLADVRAAVEANRLDLLLQPIVTLPQRKVRHYHVVAQLRDENGAPLAVPEDFASAPRELVLAFDNFLLLRAMQVVRRLVAKNPDGVLICGISTPTLSDPAFVAQLSDFLRANRAFAPALSFALPHAALRAMKPAERTAMAHIASLGFRFTVERAEDLRLDARELAAAGVRFVQTPAALLLDRAASAAGHIHAADLGSLMARYGIELIADGVETEGTVLDLLDYEIALAQGSLFSPPRPVRAEVFDAAPVPPSAATVAAAAPQRRRDGETPPLPRAVGERPTPSLARLARNVMRRA